MASNTQPQNSTISTSSVVTPVRTSNPAAHGVVDSGLLSSRFRPPGMHSLGMPTFGVPSMGSLLSPRPHHEAVYSSSQPGFSTPSPLSTVLSHNPWVSQAATSIPQSSMPFGTPGVPRHNTMVGYSPQFFPSSSYPSMPPVPHMLNVQNHVTIKLDATEDYASWRTQFMALLFSQELSGFVDGSVPPPVAFHVNTQGHRETNPAYMYWLKIDQLIRSWLFATLSRDILLEVNDLLHAHQIWEYLQTRFQTASATRALELKRLLHNLDKPESQSMDAFLRDVKVIVDSLNAIRCPVSDQDLIEYVTFGIGPAYETLITTLMNIGPMTYNEFKSRLLQYDLRARTMQRRDSSLTEHPAFSSLSLDDTSSRKQSTFAQKSNNRSSGKGKWKKGKGGGKNAQQQNRTSSPPGDATTSAVTGMRNESLNNVSLPPVFTSNNMSAGGWIR